jgi:peptidoglycan/xylan/chitin deacetylase (PgdA/CDA1 family)
LGLLLLGQTTAPAAGMPDRAQPSRPVPFCESGESPGFLAALDALRSWLGGNMGDPLECAHPAGAGNELLQRTTTGAAFYDGAAGEASFTDGYRRWAAGPDGQRFWQSPEAVPQLVGQPPFTRSIRCPVLYAHEVPSQASLRALLTTLRANGYQLATLSEVDRAMSGRADVPSGCLVLTFDDALYSQYSNALPVLSSLGMRAVFFAMPSFNDGVHRYMGAEEIRALHRAGNEIAAHTCNHPSLPRLRVTRPEAFLAELQDCKARLEAMVGVPVVYFAYPNGSYDVGVMDAVAAAGYRAAFTTRPAATLSASTPFALPRIRFDVGESPIGVVNRIRAAGG